MLTVLLLSSPLLLVEAVLLSTREPSNLLLPAGVAVAANALLLGPLLWRRFGRRKGLSRERAANERWTTGSIPRFPAK
jgi:hypothetical protein